PARGLNGPGVPAVMVTNRAAPARGSFTESVLHAVNAELVRQLAVGGARLDGLYVCPHHPDEGAEPYRMNCDCRKPRPGLLRRAAHDLRLDLAGSIMVGDKISDVAGGQSVGAAGGPGLTGDGAGGEGDNQARPRRGGSPRRGRLGAGAPARVMFPSRTILDLVARLRGRRIVIVGDLIADEYLYGKPARISREAPVLILRFTEREVRLGGGANAAHNVRALGAHAVPVGVVGDDAAGAELGALFDRAGI